ncbi:unnamed protein product [Rotaria sordida]|uniref:F-box domain-containing protein n=2 Tax=Rotaria sordida TaxID=392033 RepID=A0A814AQR0_9BILA|nr:unnamed protein product [Rotaria sordida]CAF0921418.1 unnamed protein product [Rotaria sordida]CAF0986238.1 unnamed protein product [Rotaria sordida]CAF1170828.1 unnamed protein product [Rotaria sordida]CAF1171411.1 unnamed protein product [Rotaria sordida]
MLPDEILLSIFQYLREADVLYSFYNLNTRLNTTITGYCRYVNLMAVSYKQFEYAVSYVLPKIGSFVRTFVLNGNWETIINKNLSSFLFISPLSLLFPQLEKLIVKWFTSERFLLFIDNIQNFSKLIELDIRFLRGNIIDSLLTKVLSANNSQLTIVSIDQDSIDLDIPKDINGISYPNIRELTINLTLCKLIPCLFVLVPNVRRLHINIDELSNGSKSKLINNSLSCLIHLINFQLRSINYFWTFNEIDYLLKAMPSLQQLALDLRTDDKRLVNEKDFMTILPSSLIKIDFFIRYYFSKSNPDVKIANGFSSSRIPIACLLDEPRHRFLIHTIPYDVNSAILTATISKQMLSGWIYMQQIKDLYIYDITSMLEILLILQHFRRLRTLTIDAKDKSEILILPKESQSINLKLPFLKQIETSGIFELYPLLNAAPNLDYLIIYFDCLKTLFDNESTCYLLKTRIIRLNIMDWIDIDSDLLQRVSQIFSSLRHLVITLKDPKVHIDDFVLKIISLWKGKTRLSVDVTGLLPEEIRKNLRQWIIDHSHIKSEDSFTVEYNENWFDLWF